MRALGVSSRGVAAAIGMGAAALLLAGTAALTPAFWVRAAAVLAAAALVWLAARSGVPETDSAEARRKAAIRDEHPEFLDDVPTGPPPRE
jgi:plasmid maintenance system antidote protein VapI